MNALEFFQKSAGKWVSQRTTHHLAFRRAEKGGSEIYVNPLEANDPKVIEICQMHEIEPTTAIGGAYVKWDGTMAWDKEDDENHSGETVFALVPDDETGTKGRLLRERGYAEVMPVIGRYEIDSEDALVLITDYPSMSSYERFWFPAPNVRMRASTVKRFGGFSTATFCTEERIEPKENTEKTEATNKTPQSVSTSVFGW
ncbi:phycobiliprotein lyase [Pseudanabaena mucicola]|uniref:Chromophore lyase CpcS/CpeS n=1 Tax=Pseudanabaena mucicola FACHB-723 TaxID=2692860 RepID=A0ABR8A0P4_9CYAN|nr:phycobiliprotein lyase [Pseudanabaena mucicola]MBD2189801.1 phycobiliprotein lyase [Pseudanabaena mucicola FACHB-723]